MTLRCFGVKMFYSKMCLWCFVLAQCVMLKESEAVRFEAETASTISLLAKEGKQHLQSLQEKAGMPRFGPCWKRAVSELTVGCKFLTQSTQRNLALRFTDCFLQLSGHEGLQCDEDKEACLKGLSDREFNSYSNFYTHIQSICHYLQSQLWHEETELTIDKLTSSSAHVSQQLAEAEVLQATLLLQQKEGVKLQKEFMNNLLSTMEESQSKIRGILEDFENYSKEQKRVLFDVFEELASFKAWAINEVSWLNSIVFYISSLIFAYIITSPARTQQARLYIYLFLFLNYLLEKYILTTMTQNESINVLSETSNAYIWLCRNICIGACVLVTLVLAYLYQDYMVLNNNLLNLVHHQTELILKKLNVMTTSEHKVTIDKEILQQEEKKESSNITNQDLIIPLPYKTITSLPAVKDLSKLTQNNLRLLDLSKAESSESERDRSSSRASTPLRRSARHSKPILYNV